MKRSEKIWIYGLVLVLVMCITTFAMDKPTKHVEKVESVYGEQLGSVYLPVSCSKEATPYLEQGLALLHHMTYEGARSTFEEAAKIDPDCSLAYWGQAMTFIHPLWSDAPSKENFDRGATLVKEARNREKTEIEKAYIDAVEAYYFKGRNSNERVNLIDFEKGWKKIYIQYPNDPEAATFYALAHIATANPGDKTYTKQKTAGAIAEGVLKKYPDHPGAHHYIIHAYDYPPLAQDSLEVARSYSKIAPEVPHALHMASHIFTRLGLWEESIDMNIRSADAALKYPLNDEITLHYPHAIDYLAYAYLQRGEDTKAREAMEKLIAKTDPFQKHIATAYTLNAVPSRLALERQKWNEAAALEPWIPKDYPIDNFPAMEAITYFAKAMGSAREGDEGKAIEALDKLEVLENREVSPYWSKQIKIQRLSAQAWLTYEMGDQKKALAIMKEAAQLESSTEKHPVTPGEILPARELLGDMLLEMKQYKEAQREYDKSLERSTNRLNSLYGAGYAMELAGDRDQATVYYKKLVEITAEESKVERVQHARDFLAKN